MTLEQALNILNLNYNCTEEELKYVYKNMIKKYHPDLARDQIQRLKNEEITKKINIAHTIVKEHLKNKTTKELNIIILNELQKELNYISSIDNLDIIFNKYKEDFKKIITLLYNFVSTSSNTNYIKTAYYNYKNAYFKLLCTYNYEHCSITETMELTNKITKKTTLRELRYKKISIINEILNQELNKYKNISDYKEIEPLLLKIKNNYNKIFLFGHSNLTNIKKYFNEQIKEEINKYYKRKKLLDELIEYDGIILPLSIELYHNILNDKAFYALYNRLDKPTIAKKISKKLKKIITKK